MSSNLDAMVDLWSRLAVIAFVAVGVGYAGDWATRQDLAGTARHEFNKQGYAVLPHTGREKQFSMIIMPAKGEPEDKTLYTGERTEYCVGLKSLKDDSRKYFGCVAGKVDARLWSPIVSKVYAGEMPASSDDMPRFDIAVSPAFKNQ